MSAAGAAPELPTLLPPLRDDLRLFPGAPHADGSPSWTIQDPVRNVFFRIGWLEFELLARWHLQDPEAVLAAAARETLLAPERDELLALVAFLTEASLVSIHDPTHTRQLYELHRRSRLSRATWLLHHYLFFRIPLWHPDRWLQRMLPYVDWLYSPLTALAVMFATLLGIMLAARQVDQFTSAFVDTLTPAGITGYILALAVAKGLHELGHAFTATRYGVRVAHMGVAFLVMWPMLYTDTSESWRLHDRRQRQAIASAGIITELALAGLATLAWCLVSPGALRDSLLFLATTAWVISLGLNASPFMRFDGYFIVSDWFDIPNLHDRAFALARTWLRNKLLGWSDPWPEHFPDARRFLLIAFALTTWIYRLVVFLAIAAAVYVYFFKLLGIFLFLVEIAWFIVRPIRAEMRVWHDRRAEITPQRRKLALWLGAGVIVLILAPWRPGVTTPAWAHSAGTHIIYAPHAGRLAAIDAREGSVTAGAPLFSIEQPEIALRATLAAVGSKVLTQQLSGLGALPQGEERRLTLEQQRNLRQTEVEAESDEARRLKLESPIDGVLTDLDPELAPGVWVSPRQPLAVVVDPADWVVEAYVGERERERIEAGVAARFYPDGAGLFPWRGVVEEIDGTPLALLPQAMLSAKHGGELAVATARGELTPRDTLYRVRIRLRDLPDQLRVHRGNVHIDAAPRSWLFDALKEATAVLIREASF